MRSAALLIVVTLATACSESTGPDDGVKPLHDKIVFLSERDGFSQLYVMDTDGANVKLLPLDRPGAVFSPAVSPDGLRIVFSLAGGEVYVMNADATDVTNLTDHPAYDAYPAWSPDGRQIAFQSDRDGNTEIYVMNADGTDPVNLTNNPADDTSPAWSMDGRIAFGTDRDGNNEIYGMDPDGSNQTNLTNDPSGDNLPSWSPDGQRIVFNSSRGGSYDEIFVMDADGGNPTLVDLGPMTGYFPKWSPDGAWLAFAGYGGAEFELEVVLVRPDGTDRRNLTQNSADDFAPAWSPASSSGGFLR